MEANEGYWRKMPSVKRLVYKSVPEATTRLAMLKRGEVDLAYLLDAAQAQEVKRDPKLKLAFSGGIGTFYLDFLDSGIRSRRGTTSACASPPATRSTARRSARPRRSAPRGSTATSCRKTFEFALPIEPHSVRSGAGQEAARRGRLSERVRRRRPLSVAAVLLDRRGDRPGYLGAVGIKTRVRTMERAAFYSALASKKLKGVCICITAVYGNAASRMAETVPADGAFAYGGYPDIDALYAQQARETDKKKREAMLHKIQQQLYERVRFAPIYDYIWPSGVGPARGGRRADEDRSVPVVGAARGREAEEVDRAPPPLPLPEGRGSALRYTSMPRTKSARAWPAAIRNEMSLPQRMNRAPALTYFSMVGWS